MTDTSKMREEFETAFRENGLCFKLTTVGMDGMLERGTDGEYRSVRVAGAWWGWQAARASAYTAIDMATAAAEGFRDGVASEARLIDECRQYLQCVVDQSMSRNNAEALADELLAQISAISVCSATSRKTIE